MDTPSHGPAVIEFGRFKLLQHSRELLADGAQVALGARAFDVLAALVEARGTVLSKDELMKRVWPGRIVEDNSLQAQVSTLRRALGADRGFIRTVAGHGYQFTGEIGVPAAIAPRARATNLPERVSELIGREAALAEVVELATAHRLVTLTGVGGIGKTRLGVEAARQLLATFADGVWFAEFAPLSDADLVPVTVAAALGCTLTGGTVSPERIAAAVAAKQLLLLLDNCEHVIDAATRMAEALLRASPSSCVIATSREPLRAEGEYVYRVPPLDVPPEDNLDVEDVLKYGAVRLFIARARAAEPGYVPDLRLALVKAEISRRLDGIPLAIELAAARVASFGVEGIAARLDDRFRLLTGGNRTALPRHQTLRATLDWSYELLSDTERVVLCRLAVFVGNFSLDCASAVAASDDIPACDVIDCVTNLVAKSLVAADISSAPALYRLLGTTRAYALEKLAESGEFELYSRRHAEHYRDLFQHAEADWKTRPTAGLLDTYGDQIDNVRAALDWAFSPRGDAAIGVALTTAVVPLWFQLSLMDECRRRVEQAFVRVGPRGSGSAQRDMQLYAALGGALLYTEGPGPKMRTAWDQVLDIAQDLGNVDYQLRAIWGLWVTAITGGEHAAALMLAQRFSGLAGHTDDPADLLIGDRLIGTSQHFLGDQADAQHHLERILQAKPNPFNQSHTIRFQYDQGVAARSFLARVLWLRGLPEQAMEAAQTSVDDARALGHALSLCHALAQAMCPVALLTGDLAAADRYVKMLLDCSAGHGLNLWYALGSCFKGTLDITRGNLDSGLPLLRAAVDRIVEAKFALYQAVFLGVLAEGLAGAGRVTDGLAAVDEAIAFAEQTDERWPLAELLRVKGELLLLQGEANATAAAEEQFQQALVWARRQEALSWELRGATSLARLWHRTRRTRQARKLLTSVYARFGEGFGTADLRTAKALLDTLR